MAASQTGGVGPLDRTRREPGAVRDGRAEAGVPREAGEAPPAPGGRVREVRAGLLIAITATLNPAPVARTEAAVQAVRALVVRYHEDASALDRAHDLLESALAKDRQGLRVWVPVGRRGRHLNRSRRSRHVET